MPYKVDLASISREEFNVSERRGRYLITPQKSKHTWQENELHLRSLLVDVDGEVLSSGFQKFGNYGENIVHDEEFRAALQNGEVDFVEKMDGTLIILDFIDGKLHWRTRGNDSLGDFDLPVMHLIANKYPQLPKWYLLPRSERLMPKRLRDHFSVLFEYVGPENRIVLRYDAPELYLLGLVDKETLQPYWGETLEVIAANMGVPTPAVHLLPKKFDELAPIVRAWQDKEGVVARFRGATDGKWTPRLLKIKATQYVKLHALKFKLEGKVAKLAFLLGITGHHNVWQKLEEMGIDWEAQQFVLPEMEAYLAKYQEITQQWDYFRAVAQLSASDTRGHFPPRSPEHRKNYVEIISQWIEIQGMPSSFFGAGMLIYTGRFEDARVTALAQPLLGESPIAVRQWRKDVNAALTSMLSVPVGDTD